jgi:hypothetical protein
VPVQEGGDNITIDQLRHQRGKHTPKPNFTTDVDNTISESVLKGFSPEAVATELAGVPGISPKRVHDRWHTVLKQLRRKTAPRENGRPRGATTRWTEEEQQTLADAAAIEGTRHLHDGHFEAGGASAFWCSVAEFLGSGRTPSAVKAHFRSRVKEGRTCESAQCTAPADFGSQFCGTHRPVFNVNNTLALNECAAQAEAALGHGFTLPTQPPAPDGAMRTDADVTAVNTKMDEWLKRHGHMQSSRCTFLSVTLQPTAVARGEGPTAAQRRPMTLGQAAPLAKPGTKDGHWTDVVVIATRQNVPVICETKVGKNGRCYVAVLPQIIGQDGKVANYLEAIVVLLCTVEDGLAGAVMELSAHSDRYTTAYLCVRLRQAFRVGESDSIGCQPPRTP